MTQVNAMGDQCPIPVIKTRKAIMALQGPDTVEVLVDNETAVQNLLKLAGNFGAKAAAEKKSDSEFSVSIDVDEAALSKAKGSAQGAEEVSCTPDARGDLVVVVGSDRMGSGNDELGKVLIKGFIFAVSQLDVLPKKMLFYNGGVMLTTEGSPALEDLKKLEAQGVEILSCGTCLDYYKRKEALKVGGVTNMYDIVSTMAEAGKVIRP
jgi:selenium metabolism protein YedF